MKFIILAMIFAVGTSSLTKAEEGPCANPYETKTLEEAKDAAQVFLTAIETTVDQMKADFGNDVFTNPRLVRLETDEGIKSIGEVYGEYMEDAGYPKYGEANECTLVFKDFGFDTPAMYILILPTAEIDKIDHITASLRNILAQ